MKKNLCDSGEIEKENRGQMNRQVEVYENLKLRDYLPIKFIKLSTFKMVWLFLNVYEFYGLCSGQLSLFLQLVV